MALPTINERLANLSAVGMAKEVTFGTAAAATNFVPDSTVGIETDPGLFYPKVMQGIRDEQIWALYGEYKHSGPVSGPLFPVNGIPLFFGAIGADGGQATMSAGLGGGTVAVPLGYGVTGSNGNTKTGTIGAISAGATTATYTLSTGSAPATNDFFQIDANAIGTTSAEVRKLINVTGGGPYTLTFDTAVNFNHGAATPAKNVVAPYTHIAVPMNLLPSFTVEKNLGGFESIQFLGSRINKFDVKAEAGSSEAAFTADMMAVASQVLATPTAISIDTTTPFVFSEFTLTALGQTVTQANKFSFAIDNGLKATYTMAAQKGPAFLTPATRKVNGQITVVFTSLDDATWGYFTKTIVNPVSGALTLTMAHPANGGTIALSMPQCRFRKYKDDIKIGDIIMTTLDYEAELQLSTNQSVTGTVINSAYLPY